MTRLVAALLALALVACARGGDPPASRLTAGEGFVVRPGLFAPQGDDGTAESLRVEGADQAKVVPALQAAGRRWLYVTADGEDLSRLAPDVDALAAAAGDRYTPNFVFDVYGTERGPALWVDCKGAVAPPMARTFVRIVEEELRRRGVTSAVFDDAGAMTGREPMLAPVS